jgi:membrane associated rhomboid family serine protease
MEITFTIISIAFISVISYLALQKPQTKYKMLLNPYRVAHNGESYRMLTSGFIHADFTHLLFNMITLFCFGNVVEFELGKLSYILLFVLGVIVANIPSYLKYKDMPHYNSLGASGGVSAILFCSIVYSPVSNIYLYFAIPVKGFIFAILYLIYSHHASKKGGDNINHDAHIYGALFGVAFAFIANFGLAVEGLEQIPTWVSTLFN